jgi:hypothetical protein
MESLVMETAYSSQYLRKPLYCVGKVVKWKMTFGILTTPGETFQLAQELAANTSQNSGNPNGSHNLGPAQ